MKKLSTSKVLIISGTTAVTLFMAVPALAAQTHIINGIVGKVTAVNGSTLVVQNAKGATYTIDASRATVQLGLGKDATTTALSTIAVNDHVAVEGDVNGTSIAATQIDEFRHAEHVGTTLGSVAFGKVKSIQNGIITLAHHTKDGTANVTVGTTTNTAFKLDGKEVSANDLKVGEMIVAMGAKDANGNIADASTVRIFTKGKK